MPQIFLSYRRRDNDHALSLYLWLIKRYGRESLFWDRRDIEPARDFAEVIEEGIEKVTAFIALVGKDWVGPRDEQGRWKIESPEDWVRREIAGALDRGICVIPVLGSGANMPAASDLPKDLERFSRLQALSIIDMRFYSLLAESLERAGVRAQREVHQDAAASRIALRAGDLLRRQAERLQIRAKELIREGNTDRAQEELNEGTELMMALLDFVPGEKILDVQLGYIYGAIAQAFEAVGKDEMVERYRDLQLGIFERVKDDLSSVDYLTGDAASAIKGVGEVYYNRGNIDRAIEYYRKAIEIEPGYQYAWHDLFGAYDALARRGRIDVDQMRLALQKTKETSAGLLPGTQVPGLSLEYLVKLEDSLHYWERTAAENPHLVAGADERYTADIAGRPDDPEPYYQRARSRAAKGNTAGALEDYSAALARGKNALAVHLERAGLELNSGDFQAAESDLSKVIELVPERAETYKVRALIRAQNEDYSGAAADLAAAVVKGLDQADVFFQLGKMRVLNQEPGPAEESLSTAIAGGYPDADAYYWRGRARADQQNITGAEVDFSEAIDRGYDEAEVYYQRGSARLMQANVAGAAEDLTAAVEKGYASPLVYYLRALSSQIQGNYARTFADCSEAIGRGVLHLNLYQMRAYAAIRLGNFEVAEADCASQKELQPEHPYLQALAGDLQMAKGSSERAIDAYRAALASDAEVQLRCGLQMRWRFALGLALLLSGRLEEAKTEYSEAIKELNPLETELAGHELDHWTARKSVAPEAIRDIRQLLGVLGEFRKYPEFLRYRFDAIRPR